MVDASDNRRAAYGPTAERYAQHLPASQPVVVFDHHGAGEALRDCASRRAKNQTFAVRAVIPREYALRSDAVIPTIFSTYATSDERCAALEAAFDGSLAVNGAAIDSIPAFASAALRLMQAAVRLADQLVVSSESERRRVTEILTSSPRTIVMPFADPFVPAAPNVHGRERHSVVIWAPGVVPEIPLAFVLALSELHLPLVVIAHQAPPETLRARWVHPSDAAPALADALVIVDTSPYGCDAAIPLANWGAPLVCDIESGAHQFIDGVCLYNRRRFGSVFEAVISALGIAQNGARHVPDLSEAVITSTQLLSEGPLVSIIIPTFDRPHLIRSAIESVQRQTYRSIETIVVIDGGPPLDDIERDFPDVRIIRMEENHLRASFNYAFTQANGTYVAYLNDDDVYFPNHVAELVTALERSGCSVAHGDVLTAVLEGEADRWTLRGLESNMSRATHSGALLVSNQIGATSVIFRRDAIADGVLFPNEVLLYFDYELWLRLSLRNDFVHVERITSCYTIRNDGAGQQSNMWYDRSSESYRIIYGLHPVVDRPQLDQRRAAVLDNVASGQMLLKTEPAALVEGVPWPLWLGQAGTRA